MDEIKNTYYNLINETKGDRKASIRDFCGPSSYTLELKNIQPLDEDSTIPNIRKNYTYQIRQMDSVSFFTLIVKGRCILLQPT